MNQMTTIRPEGPPSLKNIYQPNRMEIVKIISETADTKTFHIKFLDPAVEQSFTFLSGQFAEYSVLGEGEATFCISSTLARMSATVQARVPKMMKPS